MSRSPLSNFLVGVVGLIGLTGGAAALTVAEALGTPGRVWESSGGVVVEEDPSLSHDGVGVIRLPNVQSVAGVIETQVEVPSVVRFWVRSQEPGQLTNVYAGQVRMMVGPWREVRQVVLPGTYRILNDGNATSNGPMVWVDEFSMSPLTTVSLNEASDTQAVALSANGGTAVGLADPLSAPDGEDAVYFYPEGGAGVIIQATGPAVLSCRYAPDHGPERSGPVRADGWVAGGLVVVGVPGGPSEVSLSADVTSGNDGPVRIDQVKLVPLLPVADALDSPGHGFTISGGPDAVPMLAVASPVAPAGANGEDAVWLSNKGFGSGQVNTVFAGPGTLSFRSLGQLVVRVNGVPLSLGEPSGGGWSEQRFYLSSNQSAVGWEVDVGDQAWLDAVTFEAGPSVLSATWLGLPGMDVTFTADAVVGEAMEFMGGGQALNLAWYGPPSASSSMRIRLPGAGVFSLAATANATAGGNDNFSVDEGPVFGWSGDFGPGPPQTAVLIPSEGIHWVGVHRNGTFDQAGWAPLEEVPLAEAADALDRSFRTSPATPWRGVKTPSLMQRVGNDALCGGEHTTDADPWVETDVTGPGWLRFRMELGATTASALDDQQSVSLDGVTVPVPMAAGTSRHRLIAIPAGPHTVRWTQRGSRTLTSAGSMLWLDDVHFDPSTVVSLNEALETAGRSWTTDGSGAVSPMATSEAPDGSDAVYFSAESGWIETTITLPCQLVAIGTGLAFTTGRGSSFTPSRTAIVWNIDGTGQDTLRISGAPGSTTRVLDRLELFEFTTIGTIDEVMGVPGATWQSSGPRSWTFLRNQATGALRMQVKGLTATQSMALDALIPGPFRLHPVVLSATNYLSDIILPDAGGRMLSTPAFISTDGPQRVRIRFGSIFNPAPSLLTVGGAGWRPAAPLGSQSGSPTWSWSTGGDIPWMDSSEGTVGSVSGSVRKGEVSWLEAVTAVATPSIISWKIASLTSSAPGGVSDVVVNGIPLPWAGPTWLHVPAGTYRIRWSAYGTSAVPEANRPSILSDLRATPMPSGSLQEILGAPNLIFLQRATPGSPGSGPVRQWPDGSSWLPATDLSTGRTALRTQGQGSPNLNSLWVLRPSPGSIGSTLRGDRFGPVAPTDNDFPVPLLPFPWTTTQFVEPHTGSHAWYLKAPFTSTAYWVDDVTFTPTPPVSVGDAMDQPGLVWSSGGSRAGLIIGRSSGFGDEDDVIAQGMYPNESAWIEAAIVGPAVLTWLRTEALRLELFVDGQRAISFMGRPGAANERPSKDTLYLNSGSHVVRWQFTHDSVGGDPAATLDALTMAPADPTPDIAALVDQPDLKWTLTPATSHATATITHDGQDALAINRIPPGPSGTLGEYALTTEVTGPGLFRCWFREGMATLRSTSDDTGIMTLYANPGVWKEFSTPVPEGRFRFSLTGSSQSWIDEVSWTPLPPRTLAAALDEGTGILLRQVAGAVPGAGAWGEFSFDGEDSVLLLPGLPHALSVRAPAGATIALRARSLGSDAALVVGAAEKRFNLRATAWTDVRSTVEGFPDTDGVVIRGSSLGSCILLDQLRIDPPPPTPYEKWAETTGLLGHPRGTPDQDADGDGMVNLVEFAFGLPPLALFHSGMVHPLSVSLLSVPGNADVLRVEFRAVPGVIYTIETQVPHYPNVWSSAGTITTTTIGARIWDSPPGMTDGGSLLVRVRVSLP